jgi:hypothetical protein
MRSNVQPLSDLLRMVEEIQVQGSKARVSP